MAPGHVRFFLEAVGHFSRFLAAMFAQIWRGAKAVGKSSHLSWHHVSTTPYGEGEAGSCALRDLQDILGIPGHCLFPGLESQHGPRSAAGNNTCDCCVCPKQCRVAEYLHSMCSHQCTFLCFLPGCETHRGWSGVSPGITVVCLSSQPILDVARCHSGGDRPLALCLRCTRDLG